MALEMLISTNGCAPNLEYRKAMFDFMTFNLTFKVTPKNVSTLQLHGSRVFDPYMAQETSPTKVSIQTPLQKVLPAIRI